MEVDEGNLSGGEGKEREIAVKFAANMVQYIEDESSDWHNKLFENDWIVSFQERGFQTIDVNCSRSRLFF